MTSEQEPRPAANQGRYAARTGWPAAAAVAVAFLLFLAATVAGMAGQAMYAALSEAGPKPDRAQADPGMMLSFLGTMQLALSLLVVLAARLFASDPSRSLALVSPSGGWRAYVWGLAGLIAVVGVMDIAAILLKPEMVVGDLKPFVALIRSDLWWLTLLVVGVGAPFSEELLFRGFLQSALAATRMGFIGASVLTTAAWTALHAGYSVFGMLEVAVIGLYLSWLLWRTGSLLVTIFCHGVYNALMTLLIGVVPLPG